MKTNFRLALVFFATCGFIGAHAQASSGTGPAEQYRAGQIWKYKTARGAEQSRVVILDVQPQGKKGSLVHIRIENLPIPNCGGLHLVTAIEHLAIPEKLLRRSTTNLVEEQKTLPDAYFDAYKEWRKNHHRDIVKRPLADVALPSDCPVIINFAKSI